MPYGLGTSIGGAAAEGIQAGFGMGLAADKAQEEKRHAQFEETRQTAADARAADELALRQKNEQRLQKAADDAATERGVNALLGRQKEIIEAGKQAQLSGQPLDPQMVDEYGRNGAMLKQTAQNWISRLQTGQVDIDKASPGEVYANIAAATGMNLNDMKALPQAVNDWQTGMQTQNKQLMLKGANAILAQRMRMGVGDDDPHGTGGKIARKQLIDVVPAPNDPTKVFPVMRVTVAMPDGSEKYYDAPVTMGGTTDPNATVTPIDMKQAFDYIGQTGVFAEALKHPGFAEKLEQGAKSLDAQHTQALDELTNLTRPKPNFATTIVRQGNKNTLVTTDKNTGKIVNEREYGVGAVPRNFNPNTGGGGTLREQLRALDEDKANGVYDDNPEQYDEDRHDIIMRAGRAPAGAGKGPSNAEITTIGIEAANRTASGLGLHFDKLTGDYKDSAGNRATDIQRRQIDAARDAAITTARNNAAKGKRTSGDEAKAATPTVATAPKYKEGQTATGPNGQKVIFKGGKWQPLQ